MLGGDLPAVAAAALTGGRGGARRSSRSRSDSRSGPMLAQTATGVARGPRTPRRHSGFRGEAGWRAGADPPRRRRGVDLHPQPRRRHRTAAGGGRGDAGAARDGPDRRRGGDRPASRRASAPIPGHRIAVRAAASTSRRPGSRSRCRCSCSTCCIVDGEDLLDLADQRAHRRARRHRAQGPPGGSTDHRRRRRRAAVSRRDTRRRSRRGDGEVADRAVRGGPPRRGLAEGQARAHPRPGRARRRVGLGPAHRQAVQHPPRRR